MLGLETLFCWVPWLLRWVLSWFPTRLRLGAHEEGVKIRGAEVFALGPGTVWYFGRWSEVFVDNVKRKVKWLPDKPLTTRDGKRVRVGGVIIYYITNIKTWLVENELPDEGLQADATRVLRNFITSKDFSEIQEYLPGRRTDDELTRMAQDELGQAFGVRIQLLSFDTFAEAEVKDIYISSPFEDDTNKRPSVERFDEE